MILLNGHSLTALKKIDTEAQTLTLKERESTCDFTPADMTDITVNSWFLDETNPGSGIVWRVKSIQQAYTTNTPTIKLEHIINTLRDRILFGEVTPATIAGAGATTCTAKQAINYILGQQSDWVLDESSFAYSSVSNPYKFDGDSLYDALVMVTRTLSNAWWSYDLSVYPFKLKITAKQSGVASEMRQNRNIKTLSKTIDKSAMYTRFYPIGKDDLHISGNYVSRNESTYGIISKVEVDSSLTTTAELTAWANERLDKHAQPAVTVTVDGLELADATGESLDGLKLGRLCRIPLPEFGTTIEERIVELYYQDKKHHPEVVRVTMGNQQEDLAHIIADEIKDGAGPSGAGRGGGGGRSGARQQKEDHAWFEDTDEHVAMVAEGIVGVDAYGNPNWTRLSQLIVDGAGIHGNVTSLLDGELYHQSNIEMNEDKISLVVGRYNGQNYIKAAEIVTSINSADEGVVHISADHVYMGTVGNEQPIDVVIDGKLTTTQLSTEIGLLQSVRMNTVNVTTLIDSPMITGTEALIDEISCDYLHLSGGSAFDDCIIDAEVNNGVLTLTKASGDTVTFSQATSLSGAWSGGVFTVTASPQSQTILTSLTTGGHWGVAADSENTKHYYGTISATINSSATLYATGKTFEIDASSIYSAGETAGTTAGYNSAHLSGSWGTGNDSNKFTVTKVNTGSSNSLTCVVTAGISYSSSTHKYTATAYGNQASKATAVSGTEAWDAGSTAGYNSAHLSGSWGSGNSANVFTVTKVNTGSSNSLTCVVTAGITYNSSTHKYTATAYGNQASKATATSGVEAYNAGYNQALSDAGVPNGGVVYTASGWYNTLFTANDPVYGTPVYNCATGAQNHQLTKK